MKTRQAAFTLIELLIGMLVSGAVGAIMYTVASEGLNSFARNASLNRTYTDARGSIDQITAMIQSAPHTPQPVDVNGAPTTGQSAGVRFYHYFAQPNYTVISGNSTATALTIQYTGAQVPMAAGDLATIPLLGFQDSILSLSTPTTNGDGSKNITLNFSKAVYLNCSPALPVDSNKSSVPINFAYQAASGSNPALYYSCLVFRQAAFIAVPNAAGGADLRYYPQAMSTGSGNACGAQTAFNGAAFSTAKNFSIIATIPGGVTDSTLTPFKPFLVSSANPTVLGVTLCTTSPDYANRSSNLRASNSYSLMRSSMGSRSPILLHAMTVPF